MAFSFLVLTQNLAILNNTTPLIQATEQKSSLQIHECHYRLYDCCEYPPGAYGAGGGGSGV